MWILLNFNCCVKLIKIAIGKVWVGGRLSGKSTCIEGLIFNNVTHCQHFVDLYVKSPYDNQSYKVVPRKYFWKRDFFLNI